MLNRIRRIARVAGAAEARPLDRWLAAVLSIAGLCAMALLLAIAWPASAQNPRPPDSPAGSPPPASSRPTGEAHASKTGEVKTPQPIEPTLGEPTFTLPEHRHVQDLGFSKDGKSLVVVATDAGDDEKVEITIRTWDVAERKVQREVRLDRTGGWSGLRGASFLLSQDRTKLIATLDGRPGIWDAATGKLERRLEMPAELPDSLFRKLSCTPDLSRIACGRTRNYISGEFWDSHAIVWDGKTGGVVRVFTLKHGMEVHGVGLSPDGKRLATIAMQQGADIWDVDSGRRLVSFENDNADRKHPDPDVKTGSTTIVWGGGLSPDGKLLAVGDMLGVKLIDTRTGEIAHRLDAPYRYGMPRFVFSPNGRRLAMLGTGMVLKSKDVVPIWSPEMEVLIAAVSADANAAAFSPDGKWFATGGWDREAAVAVWRIER